ncbi:MAG: PP2C family protein-serine/threonine phosphatase [bacterium]|nr:PP2C family protein-serine/threonine phosphatase [bacterium]
MTIQTPVDHHALMRRVQEIVDRIERGDEETITVHHAADQIICRLRGELGIWGGRLYERDGEDYVLRATFPDAHEVEEQIRIPRTYPPIELCLMRGSIYMSADDPRVDPEIETRLGAKEFAAVEVGNERYLLGFDVAPGSDRENVLFSLGVVRHSINQRLHREHVAEIFRQARQIQTSILPRTSPSFADFDVAGRSDSMESVGGDLFDYIPISDKILGLAIADASGHGLPAALQVRDIYVGLRMGMSRDFKIVRTLQRLNRIIHAGTLTSRFVSMFYGELERNGVLIYVNAGHPPPFHLTADGKATRLEEGGPVLGPLDEATYDRGYVQMRPGDMLVLYTDGITETQEAGGSSEDRAEFGFQNLLEVARSNRGRAASEVVEAIFASLNDWSRGATPQDDRTVVVVVYPER